MPTKTDPPELRIPSYMSLEQAMQAVRVYLEEKRSRMELPSDLSDVAAGQLSMQGTLISRMGEITSRLGEIEPNSKFGSPGILLKRISKKLIGWHAKPAQQFDRTALEAFQQIRHDMLQMQQQLAVLTKKIETERTLPFSNAGSAMASGSGGQSEKDELLLSARSLLQSAIESPGVTAALQQDNPDLLHQVRDLLNATYAGVDRDPRRPERPRP